MHALLSPSSAVASLDSAALARRLGELAGDERRVQSDFLLHLEAFDCRRGYLDAGYSSLWEFCQKALHLREGAAGRRIAAMRVLRRFPALEGALREGKLCLSTLGLLGPVLKEENLEEVLARAAFRTRAEVDRLVAGMQPRPAPKDGIRKLAPRQVAPEGALFTGDDSASTTDVPAPPPAAAGAPPELAVGPVSREIAGAQTAPSPSAAALPVPFAATPLAVPIAATPQALPIAQVASSPESIFRSRPEGIGASGSESRESPPLPMAQADSPLRASSRARPELRPLSEESYSLRLTLNAAFKGELDQLRQLLSHKVPSGDLAAVLREAVRCAIEKHGKRRGAVAPSRKPTANTAARPAAEVTGTNAAGTDAISSASGTGADANLANESAPAKPDHQRSKPRSRPAIPAAIRREVWARDGGRCAWRGEGGRRCDSRWQLEFDHVVPVALGGPTTAANLRLACRAHNSFHAEQVFGREHMALFRRGATRQGEVTIASGGGR
ncbi:MAG TPA: HNH endonuclease [Anaeromyxobacteraceae bacterium]|jgi:hypothetical protein|nr:HNH endonuclease [Anaeromyxobacteraceae bacterium]